VKPKAGTPIGTSITNVASIVFDNNEAIATPPVWNVIGDINPKPMVTIPYLPAQIFAGQNFTYTVSVTNSGLSVATNVWVTNTLPSGFIVVSATPSQGQVFVSTNTISWGLGSVTNGTLPELVLVLRPTVNGMFTNIVTVTWPGGMSGTPAPIIFNVGPPLPMVGIRRSGEAIEISWAATATGFVLESAGALSPATPWQSVTNVPVSGNGQLTVTLDANNSARFYRLKKP